MCRLSSALTKLPTSRIRILLQQFVDQRIKIHEPRVLSQIIFRLSEEREYFPIIGKEGELARFCERFHHLNRIVKPYMQYYSINQSKYSKTYCELLANDEGMADGMPLGMIPKEEKQSKILAMGRSIGKVQVWLVQGTILPCSVVALVLLQRHDCKASATRLS